MGRPAELPHRLHPVETITARDQQLRIAREARGVAADIGDRRHRRRRELPDLLLGPRARRVEDYGAKPVKLCGNQRPAEQRSEEHTTEPQYTMRISYAVFCL